MVIELGYLGDVFGRPSSIQLPWFAQDAPDNADMWATADQSRADIIGLYHASWTHGDAVIEELPLDARGEVPWWAAGTRTVSLEQILVHLIAETNRHCGHADIVRELIDGSVGCREGNTNLPRMPRSSRPSPNSSANPRGAQQRPGPSTAARAVGSGPPGRHAERLRGARLRGVTSA